MVLAGNKQITHWKHPEAPRIGWFDGETIYLDENETTLVVQQMATQQRNQISQPATVKNRLSSSKCPVYTLRGH